jgi:hypothetical protein
VDPPAILAGAVEGVIGRVVLGVHCEAEGAVERRATPEAAVKSERVLVQVRLEMLRRYATVVGAQQPAL